MDRPGTVLVRIEILQLRVGIDLLLAMSTLHEGATEREDGFFGVQARTRRIASPALRWIVGVQVRGPLVPRVEASGR